MLCISSGKTKKKRKRKRVILKAKRRNTAAIKRNFFVILISNWSAMAEVPSFVGTDFDIF